jgi:hypothetical protein
VRISLSYHERRWFEEPRTRLAKAAARVRVQDYRTEVGNLEGWLKKNIRSKIKDLLCSTR